MRKAEDLLSCDPLPVPAYKEIYLAIESHLISSVGQRLDDTFLEGVNGILISSGFYTDHWEEGDKMFIFWIKFIFRKRYYDIGDQWPVFPLSSLIGQR